jgi:hypothetical protein
MHAVPAVGLCLLSGIVQGCAYRGAPPATRLASADTTALGVRAELPPTSMWPGETRRIVLPTVQSKVSRQFELRSDGGLAFSLQEVADVFSPIFVGALPSDSRAQSVCIVRVDTLATPGDTLSFCYTISSLTQPPRQSTWRMRIIVAARPPIATAHAEPIRFVGARPNPFNPGANVRYTVAENTHVSIVIYDVRGHPVATLVDSVQPAGAHTVAWDGRDGRGNWVGSGVYFVRLTSPAGTTSYKMTLLK